LGAILLPHTIKPRGGGERQRYSEPLRGVNRSCGLATPRPQRRPKRHASEIPYPTRACGAPREAGIFQHSRL